jgi:hypothetical protein
MVPSAISPEVTAPSAIFAELIALFAIVNAPAFKVASPLRTAPELVLPSPIRI